jgi:hypothetical protein
MHSIIHHGVSICGSHVACGPGNFFLLFIANYFEKPRRKDPHLFHIIQVLFQLKQMILERDIEHSRDTICFSLIYI